MQRLTSFDNIPASARGAAVAMGNFDGVHLGHQSVLALARAAGADLGATLGVVTFEPHPRGFFQPEGPAFRLMSADARAHRFEKLGVDALYELPFDGRLAAMSSENFVRQILRDLLGIRHLVVGADFRFGAGRTGDTDLLAKMGPTHGFGVTPAPLVTDGLGDFSSTAIRAALRDGKPRDAARILGHWHRIEGSVIPGRGRGDALGYPTANLSLAGLHLPRFGVYAVIVDVLGGPHAGRHLGAASIGEREGSPSIEVHVLDFDGSLESCALSVALVEYLRPEMKFDDEAALIAQMAEDCAKSRNVLNSETT